MNPARLRPLIAKVEVCESHTDKNAIYIDFCDEQRTRWYVIFLTKRRGFGVARRLRPDGQGGCEIPARLRTYLISIIPPDIIARCTAATLGLNAARD
ncbi:hypothetical protein J2X65_003531 [Ancylobacter sp. 3268]|uniref:hypothetical protein n=1 Tax=Ancylobacter sp. 3268 TaxID=2817752 RepID=UPI00285E33AE|nr:hypothetical protein [Ancylobacter sp. 3268]MDR6954163.1 hypothetical protein [Ancylobacter sp. 3268]